MKQILILWTILLGLLLGQPYAYAATSSSFVQSPAAASALFNMGSTQTLTYQVSNNNTAGNVGQRIYLVQLNLPNNVSSFSSTTAAPAGWTRTAYSATSVSFQAISWSNAIAAGSSATFSAILTVRSTTADATESMTNIRISTTSTTTGPPFSRAARVNSSGTASWTIKSLAITSFQITDTGGTPISSVIAGGNFNLVMTVKNISTATQSGIVSNPNPPTAVKTGTVTQGLPTTAYSPSPFNLAAGSSGTITFAYSTAGADSGTIYFTAIARIASAGATSATGTSSTITVAPCILTANFIAPAAATCLYPGLGAASNVTLTLALTNNCGTTISNITPSINTNGGPVSIQSGPTPATITTLAAGATSSINWVYQINSSAASNPFAFSALAVGVAPALVSSTAISQTVTRGEFAALVNPTVTNASSTNVELTWQVTNNGCARAKSVAITYPAGWVWGGDAYSLVDLSASNSVETWASSGTNPVTFASPDIPSQMPQTFGGDFDLVFSSTPATAGTSGFTVNVTDANNITVPATPASVSVTVNPFSAGAGGLNNATNGIWREVIP